MEGWKDGRMEGWKDGRMEGWKDGRMEGWKDGLFLLNHFSDTATTVPGVRVPGVPLRFTPGYLEAQLRC
jgi:hypothetical protein